MGFGKMFDINTETSTVGICFQILNFLGFIFMILMNGLVNASVFNESNNGDISNKHPTRITPASWAFSIWSLIFVSLLLFVIYQAFPRNRRGGTSSLISRMSYFWFLNSIFNGFWGVAFAYEVFWLTVLIMLSILGTLIVIYRRLRVDSEYKSLEPTVDHYDPHSMAWDYWLIRFPFSVYIGWISVATVANISIFLKDLGFDYWQSGFTVMMLVILGVLSTLFAAVDGDAVVQMVVIWAVCAVADKQRQFTEIYVTALVVASLVGLICAFLVVKKVFQMVRK